MAEEAAEGQGERTYMVNFDCWACSSEVEINIYDVQKDRLDIDYSEIKPNPEDPQRYYLKCTDCGKFNAVFL